MCNELRASLWNNTVDAALQLGSSINNIYSMSLSSLEKIRALVYVLHSIIVAIMKQS